MILSASLRDRLPSALIALALQAGLFALLVLSFEIVRQLPAEKETILTLTPLRRTVPAPVIDGRTPPPRAVTPTPPLPFVTPLLVPPPSTARNNALLQDLGRMLTDCAPQKYGGVARPGCSLPGQGIAPPDDRTVVLNPPTHVEDAPHWQAELARRNAPAVIPGGDIFGAALTLLANPEAFSDKRNYTAPPEEKMTVEAYQHRQIGINPACPPSSLSSFEAQVCQANAGSEYIHGLP